GLAHRPVLAGADALPDRGHPRLGRPHGPRPTARDSRDRAARRRGPALGPRGASRATGAGARGAPTNPRAASPVMTKAFISSSVVTAGLRVYSTYNRGTNRDNPEDDTDHVHQRRHPAAGR